MHLLCGMGCTPSWMRNSVADEVQVERSGGKASPEDTADGDISADSICTLVAVNSKPVAAKRLTGLSMYPAVPTFEKCLRQQGTSLKMPSAKHDKSCTQSQTDFFEMLDMKIEAGTDYASDKESRR